MDAKQMWEALTERNQQKLLEKHRDCNTFDGSEWWDGVYDCFRERMKNIGIEVGEIYFSGFWSQGDGACFEGGVQDWSLFTKAVKMEAEWTLLKAAEKADPSGSYDPRFSWKHVGHYYHAHMLHFYGELDTDRPYPDPEDDDTDPAEAMRALAWYATHDPNGMFGENGPFSDKETDLADAIRGFADELYHDLEHEYDHLSSDDVVLEYIFEYCEDEIEELLDEQQQEEEADTEDSL